MKLTIIGAGSAVFTKNIVTDLLSVDAFKDMEIALQDIDPDTKIQSLQYLDSSLIHLFQ